MKYYSFYSCFFLGTLLWPSAAQQSITIQVNQPQQQIDGFGFSQAFGRAREFDRTAEDLRRSALDYLFDTEKGAGFSIIRNRIGSGGSWDSILPNNPGSPDDAPDYQWDGDDRGQVWFMKQAVSYGVKTISHLCASGDWREAYADFLVQYVKYYADEGLEITHLAPLNEPDWQVSYSQMQISDNAQEAISMMPIISKAIQDADLNNLHLVCCDATGWGSQYNYTNALVTAGSTRYLGAITAHTYRGDPDKPLDQTSLVKWNTEAGPSGKFVATWHSSGAENEGFVWALKIARALTHSQLSAFMFWQGFQSGNTASAMHLLDTLDGETVTPSGIYWAFAMYSRYVRPGARRVATSATVGNVITAAFRNSDASVIVVFTNEADTSQAIKAFFEGFAPASASAWVTDNTHLFDATTVNLSGESITVSLPAKSVVTIKLGR
ncbi:cellulosome enzyme [Fusarium albosuccineum]|uniref:Cellulosome enzyme n=1 Tax=Fusarium albosuccineum TaxID=1237068 RepID=A0A8H4P287_9HYPO|nr:cellulosome enzyme [Fusarium albosuccineum]